MAICIFSNGKCITLVVKLGMKKFGLLSQIWPWRSRAIASQNNKDLNQNILHFGSEFVDPSLKRWYLSHGQTSDWYAHKRTHTHKDGHTGVGSDNTRRPWLLWVKITDCCKCPILRENHDDGQFGLVWWLNRLQLSLFKCSSGLVSGEAKSGDPTQPLALAPPRDHGCGYPQW